MPKTPVRLARVLLPIVVIIAVVWGGMALLRDRLNHDSSPASAEGFEFKVGATLPEIHLHPVGGGEPVSLAEIPGKVFLLNFWATWCEACMVEMPSIVRLRTKLKASGFEVLGVNMDEDSEAALASAARKLGIDFPNFKDPDGELAEIFQLSALPLSVIVNAERRILLIQVGDREWDEPATVELIQKLIVGAEAGAA